jgi:hypothetical protein
MPSPTSLKPETRNRTAITAALSAAAHVFQLSRVRAAPSPAGAYQHEHGQHGQAEHPARLHPPSPPLTMGRVPGEGGSYEIRVRGRLSESLVAAFEGMHASVEPLEPVGDGAARPGPGPGRPVRAA